MNRITLKELKENEGIETSEEFSSFLEDCVSECSAPVLCSCGDWVELDGKCQHGNPSIFLALGMI